MTSAAPKRHSDPPTNVLAALGGADNVVEIEPCITRLRTEVNDGSKVDEKALKLTIAGTNVTFDLYTDSACAGPIES